MRRGVRTLVPLSAAGVHFEMRIFAQTVDADEAAFPLPDTFQRLTLLRAAVAPQFPTGSNQRTHILGRSAVPEGFA
jgi:hypothetical protein